MRRRAPVLVVVAILAACALGRPHPEEMVDASSPRRATVRLLILTPSLKPPGWELTGELLWVEPEALVVYGADAVVRVPLGDIRGYEVNRTSHGEISDESHLRSRTPKNTLPFRNAARYPAPLSPEQLRALLDAYGLERIEMIGRKTEAAGPRGLSSFLAEARSAAARFASLDAAIAEGYRPLGPPFPGMGEHWIQPGRIVSGAIDAANPPVLCYARIDGTPRLVALAFTVPLRSGEAPPEEPFGRRAWHDHSGDVDDESLLLVHPASHHAADQPRVAMVHVWLWPENADGVLAQNNWRLPFAQAGLPIRGLRPNADAARGLSLWTAPPHYYEDLFRAAADPSASEALLLDNALAEYRARARDWLKSSARDGRVDEVELAAIAGIWSSLWRRVDRDVSPETRRRLQPLRAEPSHPRMHP